MRPTSTVVVSSECVCVHVLCVSEPPTSSWWISVVFVLCRIKDSSRLLAEACSQGDWLAVQQLLSQGRNIHEPGEDRESLLSLACSAGYYELVEVLLKMRSGMDDKGMKGVYLE